MFFLIVIFISITNNKIMSAICINNFFNRIMSIKCFINSNIYRHNNIYSKIIVLANISVKIFWGTNAKALILRRLCGSVAKRIKHKTFDMLSLSWREFVSREEQILHVANQSRPLNKPTNITFLWIVVNQTNSRTRAMFRRSAWSPANFQVELPALREALKLAGRSKR